MKIKHIAVITTSLVVITGFAMISPLFMRGAETGFKPKLMLSFSVGQDPDVVEWCRELASVLEREKVSACVFFPGRVAEQYPEAVLCFGENIDIGSQTYSNAVLTEIADYSLKLKEVQDGKAAVEKAGNISSRSFKAPGKSTDEDIYSLLSRSGIVADFSYQDQYNVFETGQYVRYEAKVLESPDVIPDFTEDIRALIIEFDTTDPVSEIEKFLSRINTGKYDLVNASELIGFPATVRR